MRTKFSEDFLKKQKIVSVIGLICFFLPWVSFSYFDETVINSGFDIARKGNIIVLLVPLGFIANIILLHKKPDLLYIRTLLFVIPLIYALSSLYEAYNKTSELNKELINAQMELYEYYFGESFISTIFASFTYGFYGIIICVLSVYFITNRTTDVDDPNFGEI